MKLTKVAFLSFLMLAVLQIPGAFAARNITVKGSDTIVTMGQRWAEEYMKLHPEVSIQVTGGGSGVGVAALINGTTDLANSSRKIKEKELDKAKSAGYYPSEVKVAIDSLAIVVNSENAVKELSMKQILGIYTGRINNWSEVGGTNNGIIRYCRESSAGTYQYFKENVLKNQDFAADCQTMPGTSAVANAVIKDPNAIGFGGVGYFAGHAGVKILSIKKDAKSPAISPLKADGTVDYEAAWSKTYPIWRYLYIYAANRPKGEIKSYLDWIVSPEGQKVVEKEGFVPLPQK